MALNVEAKRGIANPFAMVLLGLVTFGTAQAADKRLYVDKRSKTPLKAIVLSKITIESDLGTILSYDEFQTVKSALRESTVKAISNLGYKASEGANVIWTGRIADPSSTLLREIQQSEGRIPAGNSADAGQLSLAISAELKPMGNINVVSGTAEIRIGGAIHVQRPTGKPDRLWDALSEPCTATVAISEVNQYSRPESQIRIPIRSTTGTLQTVYADRQELARAWSDCILPALRGVVNELPSADGSNRIAMEYVATSRPQPPPDRHSMDVPNPPTTVVDLGPPSSVGMLFAAVTHPEILDGFIKAGADVNAKNQGGMTALHAACAQQASPAVKLLIAAKANVNARNAAGATPLHFAVATGDLASLTALLDAGADMHAETQKGVSALSLARSLITASDKVYFDLIFGLVAGSGGAAIKGGVSSDLREQVLKTLEGRR